MEMDIWKMLSIFSFMFLLALAGEVYFLSQKIDSFATEFGLPYISLPAEEINPAREEIATTTEITLAATTTEEEATIESSTIFTLFTDLLSSVSFPNTVSQDKIVSITGDAVADDIIGSLAEDVGYVRQSVATSTLVVLEGYRVQPQVKSAWEEVKATALVSGIRLGIVSGHRIPEAQRALFIKYFREETKKDSKKQFTPKDITEGRADQTIIRTLTYTAPPGYSRHHTGYTIDIRDVDSGYSFYEFGKTRGYKWVSRNNYENVLKYGFIPSYPRGGRQGGPEPEPWELVWIGVENMTNLDFE